MQRKKPYFSIIIPTLNEKKYLPLLLKDLAEQSHKNFEVIHIDGNSIDNTIQTARSFSKKITIRSSKTNVRNVSFQRNLGIKEAQAEWIIFMDADNRLPSFFLEDIKKQLLRNKDVSIFTTLIDTQNLSLVHTFFARITNIIIKIVSKIKPSGPGAMIGIKREIAKKHTFNTEIALSEDHLFIESVTKAGYTFRCFNNPRYIFSLRRIEKNGTVKSIYLGIKYYIRYLLKIDSKKDSQEYPMAGGSEY